ncbi:MAG TPA: M1 family metallopeptidase [Chitinophagaceae bacterium]|nr:M1 family metallopeptidase [Chitinophagaceae bacterium]
MKKKLFFILFSALSGIASAQNKSINVQHYTFHIDLNDTDNIIRGNADIDFVFEQPSGSVYFDLTSVNKANGKGMKVTAVSCDDRDLKFSQQQDRVLIFFDSIFSAGSERMVNIKYEGIPADGLIIDSNKFHHRTFFADNWPNRAHNWIPCNDHPADKASVEFVVTAPDHYQVISNGVLEEQTELSNHLRLTHWKEDLVLPTKVMVIGVADFAMQLSATIDCIPVTSWVFPENRIDGFREYSVSQKVLSFLINYIGPYPYRKLANVQSKTIFGGMENASNIFYFENSVTADSLKGKPHRSLEELFAHETAHQWFGDEASESDWPHLWLSEGFATYMTHLYIEHEYGSDSLKKQMSHDREEVIAFYKKRKTPVVDTSAANNLMQLLNPNSYQKGSWVLHMLRRKLGDKVFQKGIQAYYAAYKGKNASTGDFRKIMENAGGQSLEEFFNQWLYTPGHPVLQVKWKYDIAGKKVHVIITQLQNNLFTFPFQFAVSHEKSSVVKTVDINKKVTTVELPVNFIPQNFIADPNVNLLFEASVTEGI